MTKKMRASSCGQGANRSESSYNLLSIASSFDVTAFTHNANAVKTKHQAAAQAECVVVALLGNPFVTLLRNAPRGHLFMTSLKPPTRRKRRRVSSMPLSHNQEAQEFLESCRPSPRRQFYRAICKSLVQGRCSFPFAFWKRRRQGQRCRG
jgi:hypothetical protein